MSYSFDQIIDRKGTNSVKWEFFKASDETKDQFLPLSIADMDFSCAPEILEALHERIDRSIFGYSLPYTEQYLDSVRNWFKRRYGWEFSPSQVVTAPGVVPALAILIKIFTEEGNGVIIQSPVYYPFFDLIRNNHRQIIDNTLVHNGTGFVIDFDDLEKKAKDPNNKMMILCSPHNPVGRVWTKSELARIIDLCVSNDVYLISDEIHCDLLRKGVRHFPAASLSNHKKIITCTSASKSFNLAGLQMSNIIFNDEDLKQRWDDEIIGKCGLFGSGCFGIIATQTAYEKCEYWLETLKEYIDGNLNYIKEFINQNLPKAKYQVPEGTYFAWIDLTAYGFNEKELENIMIHHANLILEEGYIFGNSGKGFERINAACPRSILEQCLERMKNSIHSS